MTTDHRARSTSKAAQAASPRVLAARSKADEAMAAWRRARRADLGKLTGWTIYAGPSLITGELVAAILTGFRSPSVNEKTGDMLQAYIVPQEQRPTDAIRSGLDKSVCGDCPHRPGMGGECYVNTGWAPAHIHSGWRRGLYPPAPADPAEIRRILTGSRVRFGAWGDPTAVPIATWLPYYIGCDGNAGYTHRWREVGPEWRWLMASVDSAAEESEAQAAGWRTFRVLGNDEPDPKVPGVRECLADARGLSCAVCGGCDGIAARGAAGRGFWIRKHGMRVKARGSFGQVKLHLPPTFPGRRLP